MGILGDTTLRTFTEQHFPSLSISMSLFPLLQAKSSSLPLTSHSQLSLIFSTAFFYFGSSSIVPLSICGPVFYLLTALKKKDVYKNHVNCFLLFASSRGIVICKGLIRIFQDSVNFRILMCTISTHNPQISQFFQIFCPKSSFLYRVMVS